MGILGKILLVVNLLVAAGLAYLIAQDWTARQNVTATIARSALTIQGLPVTPPTAAGSGVPVNVEVGGLHVVDTVRPEMLTAHFQGADGGPLLGGGGAPESQLKEVERVRSKLDAQLGSAGSPAEKLVMLAGQVTPQGRYVPGWLGKLAESAAERDVVQALARAARPEPGTDPQQVLEDALEKAQAMLERRFEAVKAAPNPRAAEEEATQLKELAAAVTRADEAARQASTQYQANMADPAALNEAVQGLEKALNDQFEFLTTSGNSVASSETDRRRRIAHLLAHLDPDAAWQKRVALVVGLQTYLDALQHQIRNLGDMTTSVKLQQVRDQDEFSEQFSNLRRLATERAILLNGQKNLTADLAEQRRRDQEAVTQRYGQLQRRQQELQDLQGQVAEALDRQAEVEKALLDVQRQVAQTQQDNVQLLQKVTQAEQAK